MAKRRRSRRPCKPCSRKRRVCHHGKGKFGRCKGSPRFTAPCKTAFRACQKEALKRTGSMKAAGKCLIDLNNCAKRPSQKSAVRKYKRARG